MKIEELLSVSAVVLQFDAKDKNQTLRQLSKIFCEMHPEVKQPTLLKGLMKREELGSTAIGGKVALPHARSDKVSKPTGLLAIAPKGIDFQALDGQAVNIFFLIVDPENPVGEHLKALAKVASLLRDKFVRESLVRAVAADRVMQILVNEESRKTISSPVRTG